MEQHAGPQIDAGLALFIEARDDRESEKILAALFSDTIEPVINKVIKHRLRILIRGTSEIFQSKDEEDVRSEILLQVLTKIRELKKDPEGQRSIENLTNYVAVLAHHSCNDLFRRKHPERWRLRTRLRYMLTHHPAFEIWEDTRGESMCGPIGCNRMDTADSGVLEKLLDQKDVTRAAKASTLEMLQSIFRYIQKPCELDALVSICSTLQGIKKGSIQGEESLIDIPHPQMDVLEKLEQQSYLRRLWNEVMSLPERQQIALLLNLRDGNGRSLMSLLPATGTASLDEIAAILGMNLQELASIWKELPLPDSAISNRLGVSTQQVINLRKSARERLGRRMNKKD